MITTVCKLSYSSRTVPPIVQAVQGDTGRTVRFDVTDITIPAGAEATYFIEKPSGEAVYNAATISGNSILCELTAQSLAEPGENKMQVRVILDDEIVTSFKVCLLVSTFWGIDAIESSTEMNIFDQAVEQATEQFQTNAEQVVEEVIESIPSDYTALTEEVEQLNERLSTSDTEIYGELTEVIDFGINQYNKNSADILVGTWIASNGTVTTNAGNGYALSHPIFVEKGVEYKYYDSYSKFGSNGLCIFYVDSELNVQRITTAISETSTTATFTAEETGFVRFNIDYTLHNADVIFAKSSDYPSAYSAFKRMLKGNKIEDLSVSEADTTFFTKVKSINLFDKTDIISGYYFNLANGSLVSSANQYASYVKHNGAGDYYYKVNADFYGATNAVKICLFDSNKRYLKTLTGTAQGPSSSSMLTKLTLSAEDASISTYLGYTHGLSTLNTDMFVKGDGYPSNYVPFSEYYTIPDFKLTKDNANSVVDVNPLLGKKISFNGDSICAGVGYAGGYGGIIGAQNQMTVQNIGVGGATITAETYYQDSTPRHWVCRTIENMDADSDYAIVEGGINDTVGTGGIGAITTGYTAELDDTTYCGAFESMLKQLVTRFAGKKVGYIAVHKATQYFSSNTTNANIDYYGLAIKCCKKWGVPVCDLNIDCAPLGYVDALKNAYTANGDGWHPNEAGYKNYYVPKITAWLKTL